MSNSLVLALNSLGLEARKYSGRGMYGRSCVGVTVDNMTDAFLLMFDLGRNSYSESFEDEIDDVKIDNMGKGYIVYFPNAAYPEDEEDEFPMGDDEEVENQN